MSQYIDPRSKLFWHTQHIGMLRQHGRTVAPVNVEIDLSNRCSLGCQWCHFAYTHTRGPLAGKRNKPAENTPGGDLMDVDLARDIVCQLAIAGVQSVTWTGGGEPTLHPYFASVVSHVPRRMKQGLYTHGGHINPERAVMLKQRMTWVYVSLDECNAEMYQKSKGVDRFDKAVAGITRLVAAPGDATVGVGFLLHRGNWRQIANMVDLAKRFGADYVQFRPTIHFDAEAPGIVGEDTGYLNGAIEWLNSYEDDPFVIADVERFRMYQQWDGHGYSTCHWSAMQTVITPNGKMWVCANKREHTDAEIGDLTEESFQDVWHRSGKPCAVDSQCRVMCRGHLPNLTLDALMERPPHAEFI